MSGYLALIISAVAQRVFSHDKRIAFVASPMLKQAIGIVLSATQQWRTDTVFGETFYYFTTAYGKFCIFEEDTEIVMGRLEDKMSAHTAIVVDGDLLDAEKTALQSAFANF